MSSNFFVDFMISNGGDQIWAYGIRVVENGRFENRGQTMFYYPIA